MLVFINMNLYGFLFQNDFKWSIIECATCIILNPFIP